jgi:crossover junction endodeoxyribonuclease RuvC
MKKPLRILGIDPGYGRLGFGLIEKTGSELRAIDYGCLETLADKTFSERLLEVAGCLKEIIKQAKPDLMAIEELFFFKNLKTAINVAQSRGAVLLLAAEVGLPIMELTPLQIKQSLSGYGRADKQQIQKMVQVILKLKEKPRPDDAADALAAAIAGAAYYRVAK